MCVCLYVWVYQDDEIVRMMTEVLINRPHQRGYEQRAVAAQRTSRLRQRDQASVLDVEMPAKLVLPIVIISVLVFCGPTEAWYKQVAGPSYYSVGRASGLLSGIRRTPYVRRAGPEPIDGESASNSVLSESTPQNFILKTMVSVHLFKCSFLCWGIRPHTVQTFIMHISGFKMLERLNFRKMENIYCKMCRSIFTLHCIYYFFIYLSIICNIEPMFKILI